MSSDKTDRNIVLVVFTMFFIYLAYIRQKISIFDDWSNLKCNPLYLFISSFIIGPEESSKTFRKCINTFASNKVNDGLEESKRNQLLFSNQISQFKDDIDTKYSSINSSISSINTSYSNLNASVNNIIDTQNINNNINMSYINNSKISNLTTKINDVFTNITSYLPFVK